MILKKNHLSTFDNQGILKCACYGFMPNKLSFCGPDKNKDLFHYCHNKEIDQGLSLILKEFQTLYPYLKLIAQSNRIKDPFDKRVIEAYWVGNQLLENTKRPELYNHFINGLNLKKKLNIKLFKKVIDKIPLGAKPHHSFHVFSVWKRTGNLDVMHTLSSMDLCRISWGKIKKVGQSNLNVLYQPLILKDDKLQLGHGVDQEILYKIDNKGFIDQPKAGQWVSFHWNFACEVLNDLQVVYLKKYTQESIYLANLS